MKYKDYLILPALIMYIVFTSSAFIAKNTLEESGGIMTDPAPTASVNPEEICWGVNDENPGCGELWYAEGARTGESFTVETLDRSNEVIFYSGQRNGQCSAESIPYYVKDMHMCCSTGGGRTYDLIFLDEVTAYDCVSGTYYQRADGDSIRQKLISGKFCNTTNDRDYYIFKENGKSYEYFGTQVFQGRWTLDTGGTVRVYDYSCQEYFNFELLFDGYGSVSGFTFNEIEYALEK